MATFLSTFEASVRSVGTAVTLAAVGVYLHRRQFVSSEGKRTLAKISQQVTFPLFLFTKIIYCNQVRGCVCRVCVCVCVCVLLRNK